MSLPGLPTPQDQLDYYYLVRNIIWRYRLDEAEDFVIQRLVALLDEMRREISGLILRYTPGQFTGQRLAVLLEEIEIYSAAVSVAATRAIAEASGVALEASIIEHVDILSLGGRAPTVQGLGAGGVDFGALLATSPLGGRSLQEWVDRAIGAGQEAIRDAIQAGVFQGEGYRRIVKRVMQASTDLTMREVVTLARTYVQSANAAAQEAVFERNSDVVGWLQWSAVLEPSYKGTGRGTCIRCATLDGQKYKLNEEKPPMPLHPRCRCMFIPVSDWHALGAPELAIEESTRPYTIRDNLNIDAGGKREILEVGMHKGDWASWAADRNAEFKREALGPQRYELWKESGLPFESFSSRMVDKKTGDLLTLEELEAVI